MSFQDHKQYLSALRFLLVTLVVSWLLTIAIIMLGSLILGPHPECGANPDVGPCDYWGRTAPFIVYLSPLPVVPVFLIVLLVRLIQRVIRERRTLGKYNFHMPYARLKGHIRPTLVIATIVLAFIAGAILKPLNHDFGVSSTRNTAAFRDIAVRTNMYSHDQQAALGVIANDADIHDSCFQYPDADNEGYSLWCGSSVTKTITVKPDAGYITDLLRKLDPIVERESMRITIPAGANVSYDAIIFEAKTDGPYNSLTCATTVTYFPNGNTPKAVRDPNTLHYELSCRAPSSGIIPGYTYTGKPSP